MPLVLFLFYNAFSMESSGMEANADVIHRPNGSLIVRNSVGMSAISTISNCITVC